jgi:flavin-dependent dehydrogenase
MMVFWDEETDVVVVGYGGAGLSTAIAAHDVGAKVLMVEKNDGGGPPLPPKLFVGIDLDALPNRGDHFPLLSP